jgi:hypothetical protein
VDAPLADPQAVHFSNRQAQVNALILTETVFAGDLLRTYQHVLYRPNDRL